MSVTIWWSNKYDPIRFPSRKCSKNGKQEQKAINASRHLHNTDNHNASSLSH
jgi:hypothetical protein